MHIMIFSQDPRIPCGYGSQVSQLAPKLQEAGHQVSIAALEFYAPPMNFSGINIFPTVPDIRKVYNDVYYWAKKEKPDIILQVFDAWCMAKRWIDDAGPPVICYNPIDCEGLPRHFKLGCEGATLNLAMSPHANKIFKEYNISPRKYLPHSVDTRFYHPISRSKARNALGMPAGAFIFGIIGTNLTARKNIPAQLLAFKKFLEQTNAKNCYMYLHTATYETLTSSFDLPYIIASLGLNGKILLPEQHSYMLRSISTQKMLMTYNSIDVLMMCSLGEGFGIPIIEAQACGKAVIGTDFSAIPHTMGNGGIKISKVEPFCDSGHMAWWGIPAVEEITNAMIRIYEDKNYRKDLETLALENAQKYDWNKWIPKWLEVFEETV